MFEQSDPILVEKFKTYSRLAGIITLIIGSLALIGWFRNFDDLKSILLGFSSMRVNTALAFVLAGIALVMLHREPTPRALASTQISAIVSALLGWLTLFEYTFGWNLGVEQ